ncbi:MAG: Endoglucanase EG-II [Candelaria pacifica]|nr:MAG: Endoglucanase EG-II [Candelaria pacifica]
MHQYGGSDGAAQMQHLSADLGLNLFRLPVGWQYLTNSVVGGTLDETAFGKYDALVQACLKTGASCIIDIHNYARWDKGIIGQGGPTDDQFANLWAQLGKAYAANEKVIFGLMNEPHDVPDINRWAVSVQAAVTAIRKAGATSQMITLPGNGYTSAGSFVSSKSGEALSTVTNLDGSTTNLIFEVHQYLDTDYSGTHSACTIDGVKESFTGLATWARAQKRQVLLAEIGGGNVQSCITNICSAFDYLNANSDVYIGWAGWAAGSFDDTYILTETPILGADGKWTDTDTMKQCIAGKFKNGTATGSYTGSGAGAGAGAGNSTLSSNSPSGNSTATYRARKIRGSEPYWR